MMRATGLRPANPTAADRGAASSHPSLVHADLFVVSSAAADSALTMCDATHFRSGLGKRYPADRSTMMHGSKRALTEQPAVRGRDRNAAPSRWRTSVDGAILQLAHTAENRQ
jgi:hypothetical protein